MRHRLSPLASFLAALFAVLVAHPASVSACAVCFAGGSGNGGLIRGFTWGVVILLLLPFAMLTGLVTAIARASRRQKEHE